MTQPTAPECARGHGPMVLRDMTNATYEQKWCGVWHDCPDPWCKNAHLTPSPELRAQHAAHATTPTLDI